MALSFESVIDPTAADLETVDAGLHAHNLSAADFAGMRRFGCFARFGSESLAGGAIARWWGTACELQQLWVSKAYRRRGIGAELVRLVERTAIERGCILIYLETFTFQAPGLYLRLGYQLGCEIPGFPGGGSKLIMSKVLAQAT